MRAIPKLPDRVTRTALHASLRHLGIPTDGLLAAYFGPRAVELQYMTRINGRPLPGNDGKVNAVDTFHIPIDRTPPEPQEGPTS